MDKGLANISKFLSYVLRHEPQAIGLSLDPEGWADIDELLAKANISITRDQLHQAVQKNDKQRFALSPDKKSIRANQGHSIDVDLGLLAIVPPDTLYHGTATRFSESIKKDGLLPQNRQYVHLSQDAQTAQTIGARHGTPVVLQVRALEMSTQGSRFYKSENGVWLTKTVPISFIVFPNP